MPLRLPRSIFGTLRRPVPGRMTSNEAILLLRIIEIVRGILHDFFLYRAREEERARMSEALPSAVLVTRSTSSAAARVPIGAGPHVRDHCEHSLQAFEST